MAGRSPPTASSRRCASSPNAWSHSSADPDRARDRPRGVHRILIDELGFLGLGAGIGFAAGISPGPVLTLVLTDTLRGGWVRGAAVAAGPLLADGPIILLSLALMVHLPAGFERSVSAAGGVFLLYLGSVTLRESRRARLSRGSALPARGGLLTGLLARGLSPHPYLFWLVVGAPLLLRASRASWLAAAAFLLGYYSTIIGSNVALALAVHRGAGLLSNRGYRAVLLGSGAVLAAFGLTLLTGAFRSHR